MNPNDQPQPPQPESNQPPRQPQQEPVQQHQPQAGDIIQPGQPIPNVDPAHSKLRKSDIAIVIGSILVVGAIIATIVFFITAPARERANIEKNGIEATAISTGESEGVSVRLSSRSRVEKTKAVYTFTANDGKEYEILGEKDYEEASNVKAGMKATIRYLKPTEPEFIAEE